MRIDNESTLLIGGSVHYMRLTPGMWADVFAEARAGGLNAIETYCFWTDHEQVRGGGFDWTGRKNLTGFVRAAAEAGLWVLLRPGPYVGAEYSGGGFPHWLRDVPDLKYRNYNPAWVDESTRWMVALNETLRSEMVGEGGNIVMAQIENEWNPGSNCMQKTGPSSWTDQNENGVEFYLWNWRLVESLQWGIVWMWNSGVPPTNLLKGRTTGLVAGLDGDHVHGTPGGLWIEDEGWYTNWGETPKHQTASNIANRVLQFFAGGGAVHSYYMFFGGNHYGSQSANRSSSSACGGAMTCYAMDVMLNCYGGRNEPKFSHLGDLHRSIALVAPQLLAQAKPIVVPLAKYNSPGQVGEKIQNASADCSSAGILKWAEHPGACGGLALDSDAGKDPHKCAINCCQDPKCLLWQMEPGDAACWRGNPSSCMTSPLKPASGVRPGAKLPPSNKPGPSPQSNLHAAVYNSTGIEVVILSNTADTGSTNQPQDLRDAATVEWHGKAYKILGGSCVLLRSGVVIFNSSTDADGPTSSHQPANLPSTTATRQQLSWKAWREPAIAMDRNFDPAVDIRSIKPIDQVHVTNDTTDYMWYSTNVSFRVNGQHTLELSTGIANAFLVFLNGQFVGADADYSHTGMHGATRMDPRANLSFPIDISAAGTHRLDLLSVSMGLNNWLGVEDNWKGLLAPNGRLQFVDEAGNPHDITDNGWLMQPGLQGERLRLPDTAHAQSVPWSAAGSSVVNQSITWFRTEFATPPGSSALVLDAAGLGRGHAYVNGFDIGRYYLILGTPCSQCNCGSDSCCVKALCGKPSQRYVRYPLLTSSNSFALP